MGPTDQLRKLAEDLVAGCREGRERENLDRLYAADAVSVEAYDMAGQGREVVGTNAIKAKHDWWESSVDVLESDSDEPPVRGPYFFGEDRFSVIFHLKVQDKASGDIQEVTEIGTYHVENGKIVREEFSYEM
jgi:hypothetical protein